MDNLIGKTLDGLYTIRELIGTGGMANVYKAVVTAPAGLCRRERSWPSRCCGRS